jgi:actin-related protein
MKPKIIYTKKFHCDDDHPIVYYVVDENNKGMCEYCGAKFIYEEKDFYDKAQEEKESLDMSMKESKRQKDERTPSEKLQDDLEPIITAPMMDME